MQSVRHLLSIMLLFGATALAEPPNTLTLDNQSGEDAFVKVVGSTLHGVTVPSGSTRTVHVAAGEYVLLVRYGQDPERYTYTKGESFQVEQSGLQYSLVTITLHKVVNGNYSTAPISAGEFERGPR